MQLIAFSGKARSGKSTATQYLVSKYGFKEIALAEAVKQGSYNVNPWIQITEVDYDKLGFKTINTLPLGSGWVSNDTMFVKLQTLVDALGIEDAKRIREVREFYQKYGTEGGRKIHGEQCWLKIAKEKFTGRDAISDVRFNNEAQFIHDNGGIVVNLTRDSAEPVNPHVSENPLCSECYDVLIQNNGSLEELYTELDNIIR